MAKIYIIRWSCGEYSERQEGISGVLEDEGIAKKTVIFFQREVRRLARQWDEQAFLVTDENLDVFTESLESECPDPSISILQANVVEITYWYTEEEAKTSLVPAKFADALDKVEVPA